MNEMLRKHQDQQGRGLTYDLWRNFPLDQIRRGDLNVGYGVFPDLVAFDSAVDAAASTVRYAPGARIYVDASSSIQQITGQIGGGIRLFNTADNEECWIQWGGATGAPFAISDSDPRELIAEFAFKKNAIDDTKGGWFLGLMEEGRAAANTITDAGAIGDFDHIGFKLPEDDGDVIEFVYAKSGQAAVIKAADWKTIAADTWYHVGFRFCLGFSFSLAGFSRRRCSRSTARY